MFLLVSSEDKKCNHFSHILHIYLRSMEDFQNLTATSVTLAESRFLFGVTIIVMLAAFCGNTILIVSILRKEALRHSSNFLLANIALSDLLTTLFGMPSFGVRLLWPDFLPSREIFCKICLFLFITCTSSSLTTLQCLSFNRYLMITKPRFVFDRFFSKKKTIVMVAMIWVWSGTSIYMTIFVCGTMENTQTLHGCYFKEGDLRSWVCLSVVLVISVIACLIIMPTFFFLTLVTIRKSRNRVGNSQTSGVNQGSFSKEEVVITKMMIVILILFIICWIPYSTVHFINFRKLHSSRLNFIVATFTLMNTAINPVICIWFYKPIQRSIYEMISLN
ncbi:melatonin receptor type 1B-A-like [Apostichopus japonicus]|uniref:melatonin receptor type 1B-A-like n=1 Tax=Stichopus japonicus TaxID=307972 RepID=UPI003AB437BC